ETTMGEYMYREQQDYIEILNQIPDEWKDSVRISDYQDIIISVDDNNISYDNIEVTIPQYSEEGTWSLNYISVSDAVRNYLSIYRDSDGNYKNIQTNELIDLGFKTEFEVISSNPDTTPPEFKNLELSQYIFDVTDSYATFDLSADLTDDISGFISDSHFTQSNIDLVWSSPSGGQFFGTIRCSDVSGAC
ncbi:MAG: hypothetical protein JJ887_19335, partial [Marinobacter sp.]|uniref:hypothetical protein n=1 Tax=Marinobacter sp. TaxID=50741 RepID=UPI001AFEBCA4